MHDKLIWKFKGFINLDWYILKICKVFCSSHLIKISNNNIWNLNTFIIIIITNKLASWVFLGSFTILSFKFNKYNAFIYEFDVHKNELE